MNPKTEGTRRSQTGPAQPAPAKAGPSQAGPAQLGASQLVLGQPDPSPAKFSRFTLVAGIVLAVGVLVWGAVFFCRVALHRSPEPLSETLNSVGSVLIPLALFIGSIPWAYRSVPAYGYLMKLFVMIFIGMGVGLYTFSDRFWNVTRHELYTTAQHLQDQQKWPEAAAAWDEVEGAGMGGSDVLSRRAEAREKSGDLAGAEADLTKLVDVHKTFLHDGRWYQARCDFYLRHGRKAEAARDYEQVIAEFETRLKLPLGAFSDPIERSHAEMERTFAASERDDMQKKLAEMKK